MLLQLQFLIKYQFIRNSVSGIHRADEEEIRHNPAAEDDRNTAKDRTERQLWHATQDVTNITPAGNSGTETHKQTAYEGL